MATKVGKYKMTWFSKFFIFCLIIGGLTYGITQYTSIPNLLKEHNIQSFHDLEEKIDAAIDKKKNRNKKDEEEPQTQQEEKLEERLLQLIEENDKLIEKNEQLQKELEELNKDEVHKIVKQMPRFPGCEDIAGDNKAKEECAKGKLMEYIYKVAKYPAIARENGIEGSAVVQFTVGKNGEIEDITIVRDPGAGLGEAAKTVIESMNTMSKRWTPGKQRGVPVKVQYTVPLKFKLSN